MSTIQPVILTADHDVLLGFYTKLFGAEEILRVPEEGPVFYLGLRIGDTDLGLVAKKNLETGAEPRILLSIGVDDVDERMDGRSPGSRESNQWFRRSRARRWKERHGSSRRTHQAVREESAGPTNDRTGATDRRRSAPPRSGTGTGPEAARSPISPKHAGGESRTVSA